MKHLNVAIAVIRQQNQILICQRRKNDTFGDLWEFPGGKVEADETPEQCVVREINEELGVTVEPIGTFSVIDHQYPEVSVRLIPFLCRLTSGEPRPLASQRIAWVETENLRRHAFPAASLGLIDEILARPAQGAGS